MKIVLDTNVLIAAFAAHGLCEVVYEACLAAHEIVLCDAIIDELKLHLPRALKISEEHAADIIASVRSQAILVEPAPVPADACRDANDLPILGALIAADAHCLVTGDADLLTVGTFHGKPIVTPRDLHGMIS